MGETRQEQQHGPSRNQDVVRIFNELADILEIEGANPFRVRAYRNAARTVDNLSRDVTGLVAEGQDLSALSGIGKDLAGKIEEIVRTGKLKALEKEKQGVPEGLVDLMRIEGLGPKRVKELHKKLDIGSIDDLRKALEAGKVKDLDGYGKKTEEKIKKSLARLETTGKRFLRPRVVKVADDLVAHLKASQALDQITVAGSYRRRKETVGDLDLLVTCDDAEAVIDRFTTYTDVKDVLAAGGTRATVVLGSGLHVDLRVLPDTSYGAALHYFTGSKAHNIKIRRMALDKGLKISEYGIFKDDERQGGAHEQDVFEAVGLPYIPPELRQDTGEIEAALDGALPTLIEVEDLRGDLHMHTDATDGRDTLQDMVHAAREKGYEYCAITDHSKRTRIANGMDETRLRRRLKKIEALNDNLDDFTVLKAAEVDILKDGSLDYGDDILEELDITVCSLHFRSTLGKKEQTQRVIDAMRHDKAHILGHPSNRLIGDRDPIDLDWERLMDAAKDHGWYFELDSRPHRLDLTDRHARMAKEAGILVSIDSDAHSVRDLDDIRHGVDQGRRGWLEKKDVLNTRTLKGLRKALD